MLSSWLGLKNIDINSWRKLPGVSSKNSQDKCNCHYPIRDCVMTFLLLLPWLHKEKKNNSHKLMNNVLYTPVEILIFYVAEMKKRQDVILDWAFILCAILKCLISSDLLILFLFCFYEV